MSTYEVRTLEERIATIEKKVGIEGAKTLQQAANEEAERAKKASALAYRRKFADREIWSKSQLEKMLMYTIVIFCDSIDDPATRQAVEEMDSQFRMRSDGQYYGVTQHWEAVERSWGFWEKSSPEFDLDENELEAYTGGNPLPVARLPNKDPNSNESTLMNMGMDDYAGWQVLDDWFEENRGKMSY